ncbi:MAG: Uxx-star family glutaredoxin-like (seleno)protein [Candidatus Acidiferrales bacterium]
MAKYELFGTRGCPYTRDLRDWLEWEGLEFAEYDVEADSEARTRMLKICNGQRTVPVLALEGAAVQIGWQGRGCVV